jgi:23S rRNA-/tRNA-specific pseudouridylate synthase
VEYISFIRFQIVSGKKHQIRTHSSQVLKSPILFDFKYDFDQETSIKNTAFKNLLFGKKFTSEFDKIVSKEVRKYSVREDPEHHLLSKIYKTSLQQNNSLCLHAYKSVFTFPSADSPSEVQARLSVQLRTVLAVLQVPEQDVYSNLNQAVELGETEV